MKDVGITLAPGAKNNPLAQWAERRIRARITQKPKVASVFRALRAAVMLVAPDRRLHATLRFDHGDLTIHDGMIGVPDVTFCANEAELLGIGDLEMFRDRLPDLRSAAWRRVGLELLSGDLKVYGLVSRPRLVWRVLRLLAE
ncbi:MAG: hypothetical protein AAGA56_30500 [Myxococcota bacterium]